MPRSNRPSNFLLITTNLFIKLWGSSSNSIWDILLTREKCPNLQRDITHEIFFRIYSKVNQIIYSSLSINSPSFKVLAPTVFEIFCWQGKNAQNYKGPSLMKYFSEFIQKLIRSSIHHYQSIKFQGSSVNNFLDILLTKENAQIYKGPSLMKYFSKVNQVIYSSLSINSPSFKALTQTVFEIFLLTR